MVDANIERVTVGDGDDDAGADLTGGERVLERGAAVTRPPLRAVVPNAQGKRLAGSKWGCVNGSPFSALYVLALLCRAG